MLSRREAAFAYEGRFDEEALVVRNLLWKMDRRLCVKWGCVDDQELFHHNLRRMITAQVAQAMKWHAELEELVGGTDQETRRLREFKLIECQRLAHMTEPEARVYQASVARLADETFDIPDQPSVRAYLVAWITVFLVVCLGLWTLLNAASNLGDYSCCFAD